MIFVMVNGRQYSKPDGTTRPVSYAMSHCANLSLDGGGWRLPSKDELVALYNAYPSKKISSYLFWPTTTSQGYFWSSDRNTSSSNAHYSVNMNIGRVDSRTDDNTFMVTCIR